MMLEKKFDMEELGGANKILGMEIHTENCIKNYGSLGKAMLKRF